MATLKKVLRTKANKEGLFPIAIRITGERQTAFIYTDFYIPKKNWDAEKGEIIGRYENRKRINHKVRSKYVDIEGFIIDHDLSEERLTGPEIKDLYLKSKERKRGASFFEFAKTVENTYRLEEKFNDYGTFRSQMKYFKEFSGDRLKFEQITAEFLNDFRRWLRIERKVSPRTETDYLITIRLVFNRAILKGLVDQKHYPFGGDGIKVKVSPTLKIGLSREEISLLEDCTLETTIPSRWHARSVWLLSFYLAGMRFTDVITLKKADIVDERIPFVMSKNAKPMNLKLPEKARVIVDHYLNSHAEGNYLFPDMDRTMVNNKFEERRRIRSINRNINRQLENLAKQLGITKRLSMHIARHTFGNLAGGDIPAQLLQKLFNHESLETTIGYQSHFIHDALDDALDKVLGRNEFK